MILAGALRWIVWGVLFALLVRSGDLFQPIVLFTLTAGYRLLIENSRRKSAAEEEQREIEDRFSAARLDALLGQLQPHFIFNSLNTVSSLAGRDPAKAARIAEELRDLFRRSTEVGPEVTLADEIEFISKYCDVQKARFEERLRVAFEIDPAVRSAMIPALVLQPLVENAIRHGLKTREGVTIDVHAERAGESLRLRVVNDGCVPASDAIVEGIGLSNTRARLRAMHGEDASLVAGRSGGRGFLAEIRLPLRTCSA